MYSILFKLPADHCIARMFDNAAASRRDATVHLPPRTDGTVWNDSRGMETSVYECEVGGHAMKTRMDAKLDEKTGTFDLTLVIAPQPRLRDLFNLLRGDKGPWNGARRENLGQGIGMDEARAQMKRFEDKCAASHLAVKRGPLSIMNHYSFVREMQFDGRAVDAPAPKKFSDSGAALKDLRP
jgi:hypothetical protein